MGHSSSAPAVIKESKNTNKNQQDNTNHSSTTTTTTTTTTNNNNTNNNPSAKKTLVKSASKITSSLTNTPTASTLSTKTSTKYNIIHDSTCCMFKIQLDNEGNTAALCYLPTRYKNIVEFYHIEIPFAYRNLGLGDLLLCKAFEWVKKSNLMVIPTCPFVNKYLESNFPDQKSGSWLSIASSNKEQQP